MEAKSLVELIGWMAEQKEIEKPVKPRLTPEMITEMFKTVAAEEQAEEAKTHNQNKANENLEVKSCHQCSKNEVKDTENLDAGICSQIRNTIDKETRDVDLCHRDRRTKNRCSEKHKIPSCSGCCADEIVSSYLENHREEIRASFRDYFKSCTYCGGHKSEESYPYAYSPASYRKMVCSYMGQRGGDPEVVKKVCYQILKDDLIERNYRDYREARYKAAEERMMRRQRCKYRRAKATEEFQEPAID